MALAEAPGGQVSVGAFFNSLQRDWNRPQLWQQHLNALNTRGPPAAEVAIATAFSSLQGAFLGGMMGNFTKNPALMDQMAQSGQPPDLQKQMMSFQKGGPWLQARNFAIFSGVNAGLNTAMRRYRKRDDVRNTLVAGFGAGAVFSYLSGMAATPQAAFTSGVLMAMVQGGFYKVGQQFSKGKVPDTDPTYARTRALLAGLGYSAYEKNIKKSLLNDSTMWLWNDSALKEARIPAGPRLVLLHHVDRYRTTLERGMLPPPPPPPFRQPQRPDST